MKFSETIKRADTKLVISRRHEVWVENADDYSYSSQAITFANNQLKKPDRERKGTVSASGLGDCLRAQQFTFLGMPRMRPDARAMMRMQNGRFMHLRWQMEGLSEGWLDQAEVPVMSMEHRLRGTMDGIAYENSIVELKSINTAGFARVNTFGPLLPHLWQMATYMLCSRRGRGIFIYENKNDQEYTEIPVGVDDVPMLEVAETADALWRAIEEQKLYEPLDKCIDQTGWKYESCPFRDRCLKIHEWKEVA